MSLDCAASVRSRWTGAKVARSAACRHASCASNAIMSAAVLSEGLKVGMAVFRSEGIKKHNTTPQAAGTGRRTEIRLGIWKIGLRRHWIGVCPFAERLFPRGYTSSLKQFHSPDLKCV